MKNEILKISKAEFEKIKANINIDETFLVELNGNEIENTEQLFDFMGSAYDFQISNGVWGRNWPAFNDMMEDLDWLSQKKHILAINSFPLLLSKDKEAKKTFINTLQNYILPFWEEEVLRVVVGGETKEFTVYIMDD